MGRGMSGENAKEEAEASKRQVSSQNNFRISLTLYSNNYATQSNLLLRRGIARSESKFIPSPLLDPKTFTKRLGTRQKSNARYTIQVLTCKQKS